MANYHFEAKTVSRGKGRSFTRAVSYISGCDLYDSYERGRTYYRSRDDVVWQGIFLPDNTPPQFKDLQYLCDMVELAERRYDARLAREFIASLPNELPPSEWRHIATEFAGNNFVAHGLCAVMAIHEGRNEVDPSRNNPHVHIIVPTRTIGPDGFSKTKDREHDKRKYINLWREQWAQVQNRAYERNRLDIRVSHESLEVQGSDREPTIHLSRFDWEREQRGERTPAGDRKRDIERRNRERDRQLQLERKRIIEIELSR